MEFVSYLDIRHSKLPINKNQSSSNNYYTSSTYAEIGDTLGVERVGVSFEPELLKDFDALIAEKGYTNRSEAIRDLVRKAIIEESVAGEKGEVIGTLTIIY